MRINIPALIAAFMLTVVYVGPAQKYLPLEVGNRWDYVGSYYDTQTHESARDTLMLRVSGHGMQANGKEYYELEQRSQRGYRFHLCSTKFIRVDSARMYEYFEADSSEAENFRFDADPGDTWSITPAFRIMELQSIDSAIIFGLPTKTITFRRDGLMQDWIILSDRFGPRQIHFEGEPPGTRRDDIILVGCVLSGQAYGELVVDVDGLQELPLTNLLLPAYPNPFHDATTLPFQVASPGAVTFTIMNALGVVIARFEREAKAGWNQIHWKRGNVPPGVYLVTLRQGRSIAQQKLLIQ